MSSAYAKLRQARAAKNKKLTAAGLGASSTMPSGDLSGNTNPAISLEVVGEKRPREEDFDDITSRRVPRVDTTGR
ncbi:hypothetical protein A2U01_0073907, partial [Trifolium medium]|nr:hypothetical protein [Trifolium medium]